MIGDGMPVARVALALLQAGHRDAAADLLIAAAPMADPVADLVAEGRTLRVRVREVAR